MIEAWEDETCIGLGGLDMAKVKWYKFCIWLDISGFSDLFLDILPNFFYRLIKYKNSLKLGM